MKEKESDFQRLYNLISSLSPKDKVKYLVDLGDEYNISAYKSKEGQEAIDIINSICKDCPKEFEELERYFQVLDIMIHYLTFDINSILYALKEAEFLIENTINSIIKAALYAKHYNEELAKCSHEDKESIKKIKNIVGILAKYYKSFGINITYKGGRYILNTQEAYGILREGVEDYRSALQAAKSGEEAYKNFVKYFGVSDWQPKLFKKFVRIAKEDRNYGRGLKEGQIEELILKGDIKGNIPAYESVLILSDLNTKGSAPIYPTYKEQKILKNIAGKTKKDNIYLRMYYGKYTK